MQQCEATTLQQAEAAEAQIKQDLVARKSELTCKQAALARKQQIVANHHQAICIVCSSQAQDAEHRIRDAAQPRSVL
jgi:hypothetical protein